MESVARLVALVLGIAIVLATAWSVFTALVVPRATSSPAMRMLARTLGGSARRIAPKLPDYETRDRVLSFVGPAAMVLLFVIWLCLIVLGVALIGWYAAGVDFATALGIAGSSVFTLGIVSSRPGRAAGGRGPRRRHRLLVVALEIAYLPALYNQFSTRETEVTLLEARSGNPAWGPEILARAHWLDTMDELPPLYSDWERWAAAVSESHANYPGLIWFRSPVSSPQLAGRPRRHDGLGGAVPRRQPGADAAPGPAVPLHGDQVPPLHGPGAAHPLRRRSAPDGEIRLARHEFDEGFRRLEAVNFPAERTADDAWRQLPGLAGQLRADRRRADDHHRAPAGAVVRRPTRARRWRVSRSSSTAPRTQPEGAQGFGVSKTFKTPSARESNNS